MNVITDDEISDDEISDDEISDDEISDDEISCDEISDDEISDDEISDDEISGNRKILVRTLHGCQDVVRIWQDIAMAAKILVRVPTRAPVNPLIPIY